MENKKRCTIKDRRRAAQIISAKAGSEHMITPEALAAVGNMSDSEVLAFLDDELKPQRLQGDAVEEIKPGDMPPDIYDPVVFYDAVSDVLGAYMLKNNFEGEKITPLQWGACCLAVGRWVRSRSLFRGSDDIKNISDNNIKYVQADRLEAVALPAWVDFCYKFNKTPLMINFCDFCGVSYDWLNKSMQDLSPACIHLRKKLHEIEGGGLRMRTINPKESPVGAIFLLKADHGLVEATKTIHEYEKPSGAAAALPVFAETVPGIPEKPENSGF